MKCNSELPSKSEILNYWKKHFSEIDIFVDWGEPSCWACAQHWNGRFDLASENTTIEKILRRWEKAPLQRCHIIPRSLGGSNEASNLFLMCKECHDLAPNTSFPEIFFTWARNQNCIKRFYHQVQLCLKEFGFSECMYEELLNLSESRDFQEWGKQHTGQHWPQSGYSGIGKQVTPSTYVGLLKYYFEHVVQNDT